MGSQTKVFALESSGLSYCHIISTGLSRVARRFPFIFQRPYSGIILGWADPFCERTINVLLKWTLFLAGLHIQVIQISCHLCSTVGINDSWAHQIVQGSLKFQMTY